MNYNELELFFHHHCRIKLRSGKEVFGVLWEEMSDSEKAIYFASYIEHKKLMAKKRQETSKDNSSLLKLSLDDILGVEPLPH
jgi:hypothetical protein